MKFLLQFRCYFPLFLYSTKVGEGGGGVAEAPPDPPLRVPWKKKETKYQLRNKTAHRPEIKTDRFKNVFVNKLIFRYNF